MGDHLTPEDFYYKIHRFFFGWSNVIDPKDSTKRGVHYEGIDLPNTYRTYPGMSAGQSTLFKLIDVAFGIKHCATLPRGNNSAIATDSKCPMTAARTGNTTVTQCPIKAATGSSSKAESNQYLDELSLHMPKKHLQLLNMFIDQSTGQSILRQYINNIKVTCPSIVQAYDTCLQEMAHLRTTHLCIATRFVVLPSRKAKGTQSVKEDIGIGSGGTDLVPFLQQIRDEVLNTKISSQQ
jgi:indoleamine 2,3-dioxygenase